MGIIKEDLGLISGAQINPTLITLSSKVISPGSSITVTIDPTKSFLFFASFKYNDTAYRQEIQSIVNGVVTSLTNNYGATYVTLCTISGTTLTISADSGSSTKIDISLVQLD